MTHETRDMKRYLGVLAVLALTGMAALANYMTAHFGMVGLPLGGMVTAGTFAAGAVLIARDAVNDTLGRWWVLGAIAGGAAVSGLTSPAMIAIASAVAFLLAELIDWAVYEPFRIRGWGRAVIFSSLIAAPMDTVIFLWISPFPVSTEAVLGQWWVKLALAGAAVLIVKATRAVLRDRI